MLTLYARSRNRQREITFSAHLMDSQYGTELTIEDVHDILHIIHKANQRRIHAAMDAAPPEGAPTVDTAEPMSFLQAWHVD